MQKNDSVFPGAFLRFVYHTDVTAPKQHTHHEEREFALEINYCSKGRLGWHMKNDTMVYLGNGDLSVNSTACCSSSRMEFPLGHYEGIQVLFDFDILLNHLPPVLCDLNTDAAQIRQLLSHFRKPVTLSSSDEIRRIFSGLSDVPASVRRPYYRLKIQELLFFLFTTNFAADRKVNPYQFQQTERVKEIHDFLVQNLNRRFTIEELSQQYLMNTSTLKEVFKGVYGQPIASYIKEYRMKHAMKLLLTTGLSVAAVGQAVGYESQSKFSASFRDYTGMLPTQYRKIK